MNEFITKNGHRVRQFPAGNVAITNALGNLVHGSTCDLPSWAAEAAAEFFEHEKDVELGRWRDPEILDWVVYPIDVHGDVRKIGVMNELDRRTFIIRENESITGASFREVAGRWFDAHTAPPPWHNAKPGEVWLVTYRGTEDPYRVTDYGTLYSRGAELSLHDEYIEGARLIWSPEEADDE